MMGKDEMKKRVIEFISSVIGVAEANNLFSKNKVEISENKLEELYVNAIISMKIENHCRCIKKIEKSQYTQYLSYDDGNVYLHLKLPINGEFDNTIEHDLSNEAIAMYKEIYKDCIKDMQSGFENGSMHFSGDVVFNFKFEKIRSFLIVIKKDKNLDRIKEIKRLLYMCGYFTYSLLNYSVIPQVGGLNLTKQNIGKDRFDVFIWALCEYYKTGGAKILLNSDKCTTNNESFLKTFLDEFGKVENYCNNIYSIDSKFIRKLCMSGKKTIDSPERLVEYIELASEYWEKRYKYLKEKNISVSEYEKHLQELKKHLKYVKENAL